jgi:AcrR family transcriptional regulator
VDRRTKSLSDPARELRILTLLILETVLELFGEYAGVIADFWTEAIHHRKGRATIGKELIEVHEKLRGKLREVLERGVQEGVFRRIDTESEASAISAMQDGLMLRWLVERDVSKLRISVQKGVDSYLRGIGV